MDTFGRCIPYADESEDDFVLFLFGDYDFDWRFMDGCNSDDEGWWGDDDDDI